jgi:transposase-like protein
MTKPKLNAQQKFEMVLEGMKGRPVAEICTMYGIGQSHYYRIRDDFYLNGHRTFEKAEAADETKKLQRENDKLKRVLGELTLELKKNDGWA